MTKHLATTITQGIPPDVSTRNITQGKIPPELLLHETAGGDTPICLTSLSVYNIYIMHRYANMVGK